MKAIINFLRDERGMQTGEYMIMGTILGAGSVGAVKAVRDGQVEKFDQLKNALDVAPDGNLGG